MVGGRQISPYELHRSRRCESCELHIRCYPFPYLNYFLVVSLLNDLFVNLACSEAPAVLPEVELAKLALLTSKDEEAELHPDQEAAGTSTGSADTDSTLVETQVGSQIPIERDLASPPSPSSPLPRKTADGIPDSPSSVLGKRSSEEIEHERHDRRSPMEVDDAIPTPPAELSTDLPSKSVVSGDADVEMEDVSSSSVLPPPRTLPGPPPLPPRRKTEPVGEMMFGMSTGFSCVYRVI